MFAGEDVGQFAPLLAAIRSSIREPTNASDVMQACEAAYKSQRRRRIEVELAVSFDDFLNRGRDWFGGEIFREMLGRSLGVEMLITGFDTTATAWLFSTSGTGEVSTHVEPGYHAIGVGGFLALNSLTSTLNCNTDVAVIVHVP